MNWMIVSRRTLRVKGELLTFSAAFILLPIPVLAILRGKVDLWTFAAQVIVLLALAGGMLLWGLVTTAADNAAAWEPERQTLRRELDIVGARAGLRNMLISVANACGVRARTERAAALSQQGPVDPEPVLRQVLELADRAESVVALTKRMLSAQVDPCRSVPNRALGPSVLLHPSCSTRQRTDEVVGQAIASAAGRIRVVAASEDPPLTCTSGSGLRLTPL
jgi:hypothetical protein